ncbi:MAG: hypothetical protein F4112_04025 [Holophagales bacterium]|nr:hypothetical protein [Holophagales bacterium]MYD21678.1 hypothetical protein [Holophagales bacterium]MYI32125.1 hypothetical protein [Holophagales bacterium]
MTAPDDAGKKLLKYGCLGVAALPVLAVAAVVGFVAFVMFLGALAGPSTTTATATEPEKKIAKPVTRSRRGSNDSFEALFRRVSKQPCQRGGPLYVDISSRDTTKWRVRSVNHPGKEARLSDVEWGVSPGVVASGLWEARYRAGKDSLDWASAAVTGIPACTVGMIRQQDMDLMTQRNRRR